MSRPHSFRFTLGQLMAVVAATAVLLTAATFSSKNGQKALGRTARGRSTTITYLHKSASDWMAVSTSGESRRVSRQNVHAPTLRLVKSDVAPHCPAFPSWVYLAVCRISACRARTLAAMIEAPSAISPVI